MPTVRYSTINGEIIAEKRDGVRRTYVPDPLGSTRALLDSQQQITDRFDYWPYGETMHRTGATPTPFKYVGGFGYHSSSPLIYVRARTLSPAHGRWITVDPLLHESPSPQSQVPFEPRYEYSQGNPLSRIDPTGLKELVLSNKGKVTQCVIKCRGRRRWRQEDAWPRVWAHRISISIVI